MKRRIFNNIFLHLKNQRKTKRVGLVESSSSGEGGVSRPTAPETSDRASVPPMLPGIANYQHSVIVTKSPTKVASTGIRVRQNGKIYYLNNKNLTQFYKIQVWSLFQS